MKKIRNIYDRVGPVKFFFYLFLLVNIVVVTYGTIDMLLPWLFGKHQFYENFLFKNLHLSADINDTFMDFFNSIQYGRAPYTRDVIYPPLINVIYAVFGKMVPLALRAKGTVAVRNTGLGLAVFALFCAMTAVIYAIAVAGLKGFTVREKVFLGIGLCFTIPAVFCIERGNSVWLCVAFTMIFVNWYDSDVPVQHWIAIFSLAVAAAIKIYPAAFGLLLIRHKKWKETAEAVAVGAVVMFAPFFLLQKDNRSIVRWISNIINCNNEFQNIGYGFKLNLSNTMQILSSFFQINLDVATKIFLILIALANCILVVWNTKMEEWKAVALLTLLMILIPGFSWTYTMMFIFIPITAFLGKEERTDWDAFYLVLFIALAGIVPVMNQFDAFSAVNLDLKYRLGWTALIESVSLIALEIGLLANCVTNHFPRRKEFDMNHKKIRNGNIELLCFFFCICIVLFHGWVDRRGYIAVEFFFIVTGFFLANKVDKQRKVEINVPPCANEILKDSRNEILHRYRILFPYFFVSTILGIMVNIYAFQWDIQQKILFNLRLLPYDFFLLQNYGFQSPSMVGVVWYLSALMLATWIVYPILRRFYEAFMYLAPIVWASLTGIIIINCGTLDSPCTVLFGWANTGFMRAISAITLGAFVYYLSEKVQKIRLRDTGRVIVTILELAGYAWVANFIFSWKDENVYYDGVAVLVIAASFLLTTSHQSLLWGKFDNKFCAFLGKITVPIFLSHFYCVQRMPDILARLGIEMPQAQRTVLSLGMVAIAAGIVYFVGNWGDKKLKQITAQMKEKIVIQE